MNCELVLLAAGRASRFGSDKRLAELPNGQAMWRASLQVFLDAGVNGHLIVGEGELALFQDLPEGIQLHECVDARAGMSRSLACGLKQVGADFALVALADMPFLQPSTVHYILSAVDNAAGVKALQTYYKGKAGHPKLLHRDLFDELCALQGDQGGFAVLKKLAGSQLLSLEVDDPGVLRDVDVPADLQSTPD